MILPYPTLTIYFILSYNVLYINIVSKIHHTKTKLITKWQDVLKHQMADRQDPNAITLKLTMTLIIHQKTHVN